MMTKNRARLILLLIAWAVCIVSPEFGFIFLCFASSIVCFFIFGYLVAHAVAGNRE